MNTSANRWSSLAFTLLLTLATASVTTAQDTPKDIPNLSVVKTQIKEYHDSGKWEKDAFRVAHQAEQYIDVRSKKGGKLAIVLDIDETALSNWPAETSNDFGYDPKKWAEWEESAEAPAFAPVYELYRHAVKMNVTVFFVTGRKEPSREATVKNLASAGYTTYAKLYLKPSDYKERSVVPYKSSARADIEMSGYTVIETIGDQWSDLNGGHAERMFKIPNPMYFIP